MKIDRLVALIMILLERDVISARELAERLEVSRRTIYRDIDALTMAGLPIFTLQGTAGGIGLMKSYKMDKTFFTRGEISAILSSLSSYRQLYGRKEIGRLLEKVKAIGRDDRNGGGSAGGSGNDGGTVAPAGGFAADFSLSRGNESLRGFFGIIETAMNERRYLTFEYIDRNGQISRRKVEPYLVVFKENSWYLQSYCTEREDYRIFKLARMRGLQADREHFEPRAFTPLPMDGSGWMSRDWVDVTVRIHRSVMDRVIERYGSEHILRMENDFCIASYPIIPNSFGFDRLLAFGDKCEILSPPEIRDRFREYVRGILQKYEP